jgi:hypothetical protein
MEQIPYWEIYSFSRNIPSSFFSWIKKFITMFATVHHWALSWARWIQPTRSHPIYLRSVLLLSYSGLCRLIPFLVEWMKFRWMFRQNLIWQFHCIWRCGCVVCILLTNWNAPASQFKRICCDEHRWSDTRSNLNNRSPGLEISLDYVYQFLSDTKFFAAYAFENIWWQFNLWNVY